MYTAVPKTGSTLIHWALSVLGEKYNNFKVVGFRSMPMYEDTFIGHIKHDYFHSECDCGLWVFPPITVYYCLFLSVQDIRIYICF
jgi:hypothetical protein